MVALVTFFCLPLIKKDNAMDLFVQKSKIEQTRYIYSFHDNVKHNKATIASSYILKLLTVSR